MPFLPLFLSCTFQFILFIFLHSLKSDLNCHLNKVPLREFLQWIYNIKLVVKFTVSFVYVAKLNCICDVQGGTTTLMMVSFTETDRMRKRRVECCWESRGENCLGSSISVLFPLSIMEVDQLMASCGSL